MGLRVLHGVASEKTLFLYLREATLLLLSKLNQGATPRYRHQRHLLAKGVAPRNVTPHV